jgi:hypothetical protein
MSFKEMSYREFRAQVEAFKTLLNSSRKCHIGLFILDIINEYPPNFVHYKALEMIEEGDFDDDMSERGHFKRTLWEEMMTKGEAEDEKKQLQQSNMHTVFQTNEEIIEELNKSIFLEKYPDCVPLKMGAAQRYFDEQTSPMRAHYNTNTYILILIDSMYIFKLHVAGAATGRRRRCWTLKTINQTFSIFFVQVYAGFVKPKNRLHRH